MKKGVKITWMILCILILLLIFLFILRIINSREIDDVSPNIFCKSEELQKSDILWIIPKFEGKNISENKTWCKEILNLNKTLGLHGVYHKYNEFGTTRTEEYLQEGIEEFENCFGFKPTMFKPPQLKISLKNSKLILEKGLILRGNINQLVHKVYHCNDSGKFPNWFVNLF